MRNRLLSAWVPLMLGVTLILPTARLARPALAQQMPAADHTDHQDHSDHADHTGQLGSVQFVTSCSPAVQADFNRAADVSLNQWLALTPPELVKVHLNLDQQTLAGLRKEKIPVVPA